MQVSEKLLILPGFSIKNKEWAEQTQKDLNLNLNSQVVYWQHWTTGEPEPDWLKREAARIQEMVRGEKVFIIAKSIATAIACLDLSGGVNIEKLILCGIPVNDFRPGTAEIYSPLRTYPPKKLLCFQNSDDPHGSYSQVKDFLITLTPAIKLVSFPRSDHEYPYSSEFIKFLQTPAV